MNDRLSDLRHSLAEPLPHPDLSQLQDYTAQTTALILRHFDTLREQEIGRPASREMLEALLREPPPEVGQDFTRVLAEFHDKVMGNAFRVNHPRFFAFVPGAPTYLSVLGDMLCAGTNFFAGVWLEAAGPAQVELLVLDWFKEFLGLPAATHGILTGGGSEANLTALVVAREGLDYEERGRAVLYASDQRHWSVDRAAKVIGLHPDQIRGIPVSDRYEMQPAALASAVARDRNAGMRPWAVVANAGATNTGSVDPLPALADICRDEKLWLHVDAAYGWAAVLADGGKRQLAGIDRADSLTLDPHKWFGQTFEVGCLLVREGRRLAETFGHLPEYMQDVEPATDEINFCDHGIALTRRFRALKVWLSVKVLGVSWFRALTRRCLAFAEFTESWLQQSTDFEMLCPRQLSIVCFRYAPAHLRGEENRLDQLNEEIVTRLCATRRAFLSSTRLRGRYALRLCFVNWRTTLADVVETLELLARLGCEADDSHRQG